MDAENECPGCRNLVGPGDKFCTKCGRFARPPVDHTSPVRPIAAMLLGLIPGLFSIWGMGHFLAGSLKKGFGYFILGLFMLLVAPLTVILFAQSIGDLLALAVVGTIVWLALWTWQAADAYWEAGGD